MKKILILILCLVTVNLQGQISDEQYNEILDRGTEYFVNGEVQKAIPYFDSLVIFEPELYLPYQYLGFIYFALKDVDKSIENFEKMIALNQSFSISYQYLGFLYLQKNQYSKSLKYSEQAYEIEQNPQNFQFLSYLYYSTFNDEKLLEIIDKEKVKNEDSFELLKMEAKVHVRMKDLDKAKVILEKLVKIKPNDAGLLYSLWFVQKSTGQGVVAQITLEDALMKGIDKDLEASILSSLKQYDKSHIIIDSLLSNANGQSELTKVLALKGKILQEQKDFTAAANCYQKIIAIGKHNSINRIKNELAYCNIRQGKYEEALSILDTLILSFPKYDIIRANRARTLMELGKRKEALQEIDKAIALNPKEAYGYMVKSMIAFKQNSYETACIDYYEAVARYGDNLYETEDFFIDIYWFCN